MMDKNDNMPKLIIIASMQKSGSSWFCNMIVDVLGVVEKNNTRDIRKKHDLEKLLAPYYTPTLRTKFTRKILNRFVMIASKTSCLVFKTHRPPIELIAEMMNKNLIRVIYIYRDPRDIIVSALDHGKKERDAGKWPIRGFAKLTGFNRAFKWYLKSVIPVAKKWLNVEGLVLVRYEDLLNDTFKTIKNTLSEIGVHIGDQELENIIQSYSAKKLKEGTVKDALHLNKAKIGRYKGRLDAKQEEAVLEGVGRLSEILFYKER